MTSVTTYNGGEMVVNTYGRAKQIGFFAAVVVVMVVAAEVEVAVVVVVTVQ